jgi:hypothetical protein
VSSERAKSLFLLGGLESEGEKRGPGEASERRQVIPSDALFQDRRSENREYGEGDDFLDDFQLKAGKCAVAEPIRRHR